MTYTFHLATLAERSYERHGDYPSLWFEGDWHSSRDQHERACRVAGGLAASGIEPGDRVVVMAANCPEVPIAYTAAWRVGAVVTPAIFLLTHEELRHVLVDSGAKAVVTSPDLLSTVRAAAADAGLPLVVSTGDGDEGVVPFAELEAAEPLAIAPREPSDLAALMYTGGTTGRAKGVMLSHESLWRAGDAAQRVGHVPGVTRGLGSLPLSHAFGLLVTVVGLHQPEPGVAVLMRWFQPGVWLELAQEHRVQASAVVPSMIQMLLGEPLEDYDLSELRYLASGGAPLPVEVAEELERRLPHVEVREGYGLTETGAILTASAPGKTRRGAVGTPVPGVELRILDDADGEVPVGEVGEICARSPMLMRGYWRSPETTEDAMRGGWFHTGDLGRIDEDGYVYVVDRKKDLIIRGGFNVFPRDVEEALLEHPAIVAAGVVGRPDATHGEEVVAFVELRSGANSTVEELVAFGKQRLGGYRYPRDIHVVGSLPLTTVGKVDRKALRARAAES